MVKRKREDSHAEWTSQEHPKMSPVIGNLPRITAPSVLSAAEVELREVMDDFVTVYERLDQVDDSKTKPNYSYTEMIYLAILRSPNFCLPISEIYKYIKTRFSFFRSSARKHWCNAVRHSLSKTKCFTKITVGRGSSGNNKLNRSTYLWCIVPGSIVNFARGDYRPNVDKESGTNTLRWGYFRVNAGQFWDQVAVYLEKKMEVFQQLVFTTSSPGKVLEAQACYITGSPSTNLEKSSARHNLSHVHIFSAKPENQPTHTVHHEPNRNTSRISESGFSHSILKSPDVTQNSSTDSGNESLIDISPQEKRRKHAHTNDVSKTVYGSFSSENSSVLDDTRKTPDLPDLGHVSPLSISPSLSPVGNTSYGNDPVTSFVSMFPSAPTYASTPVVTSYPQPRIRQMPTQYSQSISPSLFPSLSPASCQNSRESSVSAPEYFYQPYPPSIHSTLPYLQSAANNPLVTPSSISMSHGTPATPSYWPYQTHTGSYGFGSHATQMNYQHNPYSYYSSQYAENPLTLNLQQKLDYILPLDALDWGSV